MGDAGAACEFTQRKIKALRFTQDFQRRVNDRASQLAADIMRRDWSSSISRDTAALVVGWVDA